MFFGLDSSTAQGLKLGVYHSVIILSDVSSFLHLESQNFNIAVHDPLILLAVTDFFFLVLLTMDNVTFFVSLFQMNSIFVLFLA